MVRQSSAINAFIRNKGVYNELKEILISKNAFNSLYTPLFLIKAFIALLCLTILSGTYPSFILSGFNPVRTANNLIKKPAEGSVSLRKSLVVFQFFLAQLLLIAALIVNDQMDYLLSKDLGFASDAIITLGIPMENISQRKAFRDEMKSITGVYEASLLESNPSSGSVSAGNYGLDGGDDYHQTQAKMVDGNYVGLFELDIIEGRGLNDQDTMEVFLVNEAFCRYWNIPPHEFIGRKLDLWGPPKEVVGVVRDFHMQDLRSEIQPLVLANDISSYYQLSAKINMEDRREVLGQMETVWKRFYPDHAFDYDLYDENLAEFYESEERLANIFSIFSGISILIGCLGLFGLITFMVNQKVREIGIRKVFGASVTSILVLLNRDFVKLIVLAFVVALPFAWYMADSWLSDFQYRIALNAFIPIAAVCGTLAISLFTVSFKTFQAAQMNPVCTLKDE
jgi:hypothetical protein